MNNEMKRAKGFMNKLMTLIKSTTKMTWNKNELITLILTQWIEFLEEDVR